MNSSIAVQAFDHVTIIVNDLDATRRFYVNWLGLTELPRPNFDFPGAWFGVGSVQIHATVASPQAGMAGWGDRQVQSLSRGHHLAFKIEDVDAALPTLERLEIEIAVQPKKRPDGATQIYIYDPDRHLVELFSVTAIL